MEYLAPIVKEIKQPKSQKSPWFSVHKAIQKILRRWRLCLNSLARSSAILPVASRYLLPPP